MASSSKPKLSTNTLIAAAALVSLLALVALFLVGRTLVSKAILNGKVISGKLKAEHQLDSNLAALPTLASNYQDLGNLQGVIETSIPTTPDFPALAATLESIAGQSGVELDSVSPGSTTATTAAAPTTTPSTSLTATGGSTTSAQPYPINIAVKGSYQNVLKLLSDLQLSARPFNVTAVTTSGTTAEVTATISATAYYYNPSVLQNKTEVIK